MNGSEAKVQNTLKKYLVLCAGAMLFACVCLFAFSACAPDDKQDLIGEWKIANTEVTVVFSDNKFKMVGNTFDYTIDSGNKTITYSAGGAKGTAKYTFSSDKKQLTLEEAGGKTTVFNKVSNNGNAEPSAGVSTSTTQPAQGSSSGPEPEESANDEQNGNE